jgi:hypothetical protein
MRTSATQRKLAVHGPVIELECAVPAIDQAIEALLGCFVVPGWPEGFCPVVGSIRPYDTAEVTRCISPTARHLARAGDLMDIYEEGERYWLVDDRWGLAEINLLRNQWRSWIVPELKIDAIRAAEFAILWPLAQLIRRRGVHLIPAASAVRDGFAALVLCPFGIEPELSAMISAGYRVIGQRWTALREEDGRVALLHMPGRVERWVMPRLRSTASESSGWLDLMDEHDAAWQNHAFCDAVLIAEAGRRPKAHLREVAAAESSHVLRRIWPMVELHPTGRQSQIAARLAQTCRCGELQLSRNPKDLLALLNTLRYSTSDRQQHSVAA